MVHKLRSPTRRIDNMGLKVEQLFLKLPRKELAIAGRDNTRDGVDLDDEAMVGYLKRNAVSSFIRSHTTLHNHFHDFDPFPAMPSVSDIIGFDTNPFAKTMIIAQINDNTAKVQGYVFVRKKRERRRMSLSEIDEFQEYVWGGKRIASVSDFERLVQLVDFQVRAIPAEGHRFDAVKFSFEAVA
jgi:hypothetical protein